MIMYYVLQNEYRKRDYHSAVKYQKNQIDVIQIDFLEFVFSYIIDFVIHPTICKKIQQSDFVEFYESGKHIATITYVI